MKPNFIVIGAPKAATTTLCALVSEHPEVFMVPRKGTEFFSNRYDFGWDWYEALFDKANGAKAIGEGSPSYTGGLRTPEVARRIAHHLPDVRLIYVVRNPIKRIESHYAQLLDNGKRFESFAHAVRTCPPLVEASRYSARTNDYRNHFPEDRLLVLFFEDLRDDPQGTLERCFEYLGVDPTFSAPDPTVAKNTRADKRTDRSLMRWIRKHPSYVKLQWAVPQWVTDLLKPVLRRPIKVDVTWDEGTKQWALDELAADIRSFLDSQGKPTDYWNLH